MGAISYVVNILFAYSACSDNHSSLQCKRFKDSGIDKKMKTVHFVYNLNIAWRYVRVEFISRCKHHTLLDRDNIKIKEFKSSLTESLELRKNNSTKDILWVSSCVTNVATQYSSSKDYAILSIVVVFVKDRQEKKTEIDIHSRKNYPGNWNCKRNIKIHDRIWKTKTHDLINCLLEWKSFILSTSSLRLVRR